MKKKLFFNLHEKQNLIKMMKKVLNVNSLKSQQSTIDVRFFNVHAFFLDTHSSEISDLKKEIKKKNLIFVKINVTQQ